jgi:hypothetical protein
MKFDKRNKSIKSSTKSGILSRLRSVETPRRLAKRVQSQVSRGFKRDYLQYGDKDELANHPNATYELLRSRGGLIVWVNSCRASIDRENWRSFPRYISKRPDISEEATRICRSNCVWPISNNKFRNTRRIQSVIDGILRKSSGLPEFPRHAQN